MKKLSTFFCFIIAIAFNAQIKQTSGSWDVLKGQTEINVVLSFDNVKITTDNFSENQFIENHKKAFIGRGKTETEWNTWKEGWDNYRENVFADELVAGLNKSKKIKFGRDLDAPYTMVVDAVWFYPGWSGGFVFQPAKVSANIRFVETKNPANTVLELAADKFEGAGSGKKEDLAMEYNRIGQVYEKMGKTLAKQIDTKAK